MIDYYYILNYSLEKWFFFFVFFFVFLGPHLRHMEVPRLGIELEMQLPAHATTMAMPDLNRICKLGHSLQPHWILNPLSEDRDWTCILMDTSQVCFCWATIGTPHVVCQILHWESKRYRMVLSVLAVSPRDHLQYHHQGNALTGVF